MNPVDYTGQEKRITFQLYERWFRLTDGALLPSLKRLSPEDINPYKDNIVLIDLRDPDSEPTFQIIGRRLKQDFNNNEPVKYISDIPRRTLLSRLTDHYMEVLGNQAPVSFDAEFNNQIAEKIFYRGILLPFSDDGEKINFILGAIRWISDAEKQKRQDTEEETPAAEIMNGTSHDTASDSESPLLAALENCRTLAQGGKASDPGSRKLLYEALGAVLDFHLVGLAAPKAYATLLRTENLKAQKRAPFTPTLKLCFGRNYDKTRLAEYAACLSYAHRQGHNGASLPDFLENFSGGIKGCVKAERDDRDNPTQTEETNEEKTDNRQIIARMPPLFSLPLPDDYIGEEDAICVMLTRRNGDQLDVIQILNPEENNLDSILNISAEA